MLVPDVRQRHCEPEMMDQPDLDEDLHRQALVGLERINRWSSSTAILWPPVRDAARRLALRPLRLLDLATGAGDVPIRLAHRAHAAGLSIELHACDRSHAALAYARERAQAEGVAVHFFDWDALAGPLPEHYDVITCSLFLHHLGEDEAVQMLGFLRQAADLVLISDLRRCATGMLLARVMTRLLTSSPVVHRDGPLSVAAAFTPAEVRDLARRAGLTGATVRRRWPFRYLLSWQRARTV